MENDDEFALAYRLATADGALYGPIQFVRYDKRSDKWSHLTITPPRYEFQERIDTHCEGMVGGVEHKLGRYFIRVEITPSAVCTIILASGPGDSLAVEKVLDGWTEVFLNSGAIIYKGSMVHFADVHPETLWIYDVESGKISQLYPQPHDPFRDDFATKLEKVTSQNRCRENNWACEPDRFTCGIESPIIHDQESGTMAFHVTFETEGFIERDDAEKAGLRNEEYVYVFQLRPFRWREFATPALKRDFGTESLADLLSPKMLKKVFTTPAPN